MKDFLKCSEDEKKWLKIGLLILGAVLFVTNTKPAYQGISQLSIWQKKPRQAELSPNFKPPPYYEGELSDLGTARFVTLDVLVLVFKRIGEAELTQSEINDISQGVELAREFFWRNSNLQLNLRPTFLEIGAVSEEFISEEGKIWPKSGLLEEGLLERGVEKDQYDMVFLFYPDARGTSGSGMKLEHLGSTAYSFASLPRVETANVYPDGPSLTWVFASQLWYSINAVVYGQDPVEVADWGALASTLRHYPIQDPPKPYGRIYLALDFDLDGVPDDELMVPLRETDLGQNREMTDSDRDGLEDKREITVGIFEGTDSTLADTDGDGLEDGEDPKPLDPNE